MFSLSITSQHYLNMSKQNSIKAVSIFSGAGGLDIGFEMAGFHIQSALEIHPSYYKTLIENKGKRIQIGTSGRYFLENATILNEDIRNINARDLSAELDCDCLIGGPPCQAFSSAGKMDSIFDSRGQLIYEYLRILSELRPKTFLFENVRGLVTARGTKNEPGEILIELLHLFEDVGYSCRVSLLNSADYGSYQRRVRCFILGSRIAAAPFFPATTHSKDGDNMSLFGAEKSKWNSLGDFLSKYGSQDPTEWTLPTEALREQLVGIENGKGIRSKGRAEATRPNGHWGYRQGTFIADPCLPARTVTGSSSQDWVRMADGTLRRLTLREVAKLQGFPDEWVFCGSKSDQFQQVGNAVPTIFGEVLGRLLADYLLGDYMTYPDKNELALPRNIIENISYTKRDNEINGAYRARSARKIDEPQNHIIVPRSV